MWLEGLRDLFCWSTPLPFLVIASMGIIGALFQGRNKLTLASLYFFYPVLHLPCEGAGFAWSRDLTSLFWPLIVRMIISFIEKDIMGTYMADDAWNLCNYLMGRWLVKCFSFILYMLAWVGCRGGKCWQASSERLIMPLCVLYVGYWVWWQEGAFHMASDRDEQSGWLMGTRQWVFPAVPGANRWTQRYCCCIVVIWEERRGDKGNRTPSLDLEQARGKGELSDGADSRGGRAGGGGLRW